MNQRLFAATCLLCASLPLSAQQFKSLTWVNLFKVSPGQEEEFVKKGNALSPLLDKLLADGVINAYGTDVDVLHVPGATNVAFWVEAPDWAALQKLDEATDAWEKANPRVMSDLRAMADASAHHDLIVGTRVRNSRSVPAGSKPLEDFDIVRVKPGRMPEYVGLFEKYNKPVLDKLISDNVIYAYELCTEAVHTEAPGLAWVIVVMPDLGTKDKVTAAFNGAMDKLPASESSTLEKLYHDMVEPGSHRDSLSISVVFKSK